MMLKNCRHQASPVEDSKLNKWSSNGKKSSVQGCSIIITAVAFLLCLSYSSASPVSDRISANLEVHKRIARGFPGLKLCGGGMPTKCWAHEWKYRCYFNNYWLNCKVNLSGPKLDCPVYRHFYYGSLKCCYVTCP
ncbi:uncharacterized protein [Pocillopora verrucosa]|uniref:uncharacterized protein n=1 Tax=Pocillopora verrucosa TaxID=203993 RepID=UPI00333EE141